MRRVTGYLFQGQAKVEMPLGGLGRRLDERPGDERGTTIFIIDGIPVFQHQESELVTCADDEQRRSAVKSSPCSEI